MSTVQEERALILQGGGSLGAYEAGAYRGAYQFLRYRDKERGNSEKQLFNIVAGTSIGAINAAILASYVIENKTWEGTAERLVDFWNYISKESISDTYLNYITAWWNYWRQFFIDIAPGEAARRYYSSKGFALTGLANVFSPPHTEIDKKFLDPFNAWHRYDNRPLKESLERFAKFPIATSHEKDQPRLLLIAVDVAEGVPVVFDSYEKEDGTRKSGYGRLIVEKRRNDDENKVIDFEHVIRYPQGITSDHVIASAAVPVTFDYVPLEVERYDPQINEYKKTTRYFWDGGVLANTPLSQVVTSHRQYWRFVRKAKDLVPKLDVLQINLHPSRVDKVPWDRDGVISRNLDIIFGDRTQKDETTLLLMSEYMDLVKKLIKIAKDNGVKQEIIDGLLDESISSQDRLHDVRATTYRDGVEGAFNIGEIIRIERKHDEHSIANKIFDFSSDTIKQLIQDGYDDVVDHIKEHFGVKYLKAANMEYAENEN